MLDIFTDIQNWVSTDKKFALATVVSTWGSGPRKVGDSMAISGDREVLGSVSGGCVEEIVVSEALEVLRLNQAKQLHYRITHEDAWKVGLSCGGKLDLLVEPFMAFDLGNEGALIWSQVQEQVEQNRDGILLTRLEEGEKRHTFVLPDGSKIGANIEDSLLDKTLQTFLERKNQLLEEEGIYYFAKIFPRQSELLIIGAAHMAEELVLLANYFNFRTIVIEPRGFFSNKADFASPPDQLIEKWPVEVLSGYNFDQYTYAVTLSHDPKIDDQALQVLLNSGIGYIGALGSRRTHEKRKTRLANAGYSEEQINRIHGPIGVNIKAKSAKEIALSIMAEIIAVKNQHL